MVQQPRSVFVEYPESDGQPMTESDATRNYLVYCVASLRLFFQGRPQIYVSGNLFIYYEEGETNKNISPDVFVIFGVSNRERRSYKTWQEGNKLPSFVLELTSKSTKKQDEETKPELYRQLGVQEYFQYDPTGDYLQPQLKGRTLVDGQYQAIEPQTLSDGTIALPSRVLGLELQLLPASVASFLPSPLGAVTRALRLFDPATSTPLLTYSELEQSRVQAEQVAAEEWQRAEVEQQRAAEERQRAEAEQQRAERLAEHLRSIGIDPDSIL